MSVAPLIEYLRQLSMPGTPGDQAADALTEQAATIASLRQALELLEVQATPEIAPGWVGIPKVEWDAIMNHLPK